MVFSTRRSKSDQYLSACFLDSETFFGLNPCGGMEDEDETMMITLEPVKPLHIPVEKEPPPPAFWRNLRVKHHNKDLIETYRTGQNSRIHVFSDVIEVTSSKRKRRTSEHALVNDKKSRSLPRIITIPNETTKTRGRVDNKKRVTTRFRNLLRLRN